MNKKVGKKKRPGAKLTEDAVRDIRKNHKKVSEKDEYTSRYFAEKHGVSCGTINNALKKETWKDV